MNKEFPKTFTVITSDESVGAVTVLCEELKRRGLIKDYKTDILDTEVKVFFGWQYGR